MHLTGNALHFELSKGLHVLYRMVFFLFYFHCPSVWQSQETVTLAVLTVFLIGRVGEVEHSVLLQSSSCYCRIHQRVVKVQLIYGQGQPTVTAAYHRTTPAVVVVLVPYVDDDGAVCHLNRLQKEQRGRQGLKLG